MFDQKVTIPFGGLKDGEHQFSFHINNSFFEQVEESTIQKGVAKVEILLKKGSRIMVAQTKIVGTVEVECDFCLEMFNLPCTFDGILYVKYGENPDEANDEVMIIPENESILDLTHYVYESIHLCLPYVKQHPENEDGTRGCNEEMVEKLNSLKTDEEEKTDPRWDKLKDII